MRSSRRYRLFLYYSIANHNIEYFHIGSFHATAAHTSNISQSLLIILLYQAFAKGKKPLPFSQLIPHNPRIYGAGYLRRAGRLSAVADNAAYVPQRVNQGSADYIIIAALQIRNAAGCGRARRNGVRRLRRRSVAGARSFKAEFTLPGSGASSLALAG